MGLNYSGYLPFLFPFFLLLIYHLIVGLTFAYYIHMQNDTILFQLYHSANKAWIHMYNSTHT